MRDIEIAITVNIKPIDNIRIAHRCHCILHILSISTEIFGLEVVVEMTSDTRVVKEIRKSPARRNLVFQYRFVCIRGWLSNDEFSKLIIISKASV